MPGYLVFPLMGIDAGIFNVVVVSLASSIHGLSRKVLRSVTDRVMKLDIKRKVAKREFRACCNFKVKFGSNFIDRGTTLMIQNFCTNQTASLSLIQSNRQGL